MAEDVRQAEQGQAEEAKDAGQTEEADEAKGARQTEKTGEAEDVDEAEGNLIGRHLATLQHPRCTPCTWAAVKPLGCVRGMDCDFCHHESHRRDTISSLRKYAWKRNGKLKSNAREVPAYVPPHVSDTSLGTCEIFSLIGVCNEKECPFAHDASAVGQLGSDLPAPRIVVPAGEEDPDAPPEVLPGDRTLPRRQALCAKRFAKVAMRQEEIWGDDRSSSGVERLAELEAELLPKPDQRPVAIGEVSTLLRAVIDTPESISLPLPKKFVNPQRSETATDCTNDSVQSDDDETVWHI